MFDFIISANDAALVTTLEYNNLKMNHSRIEVYTPYDYADLYLQNRVSKFDFAVTFSSLEHAGLGRYSDPLNPFGDLEAMAQVLQSFYVKVMVGTICGDTPMYMCVRSYVCTRV